MIFVNGVAYVYNYKSQEIIKLGQTEKGLVLLDKHGNLIRHDKADINQYIADFIADYEENIKNAINLAIQKKDSKALTIVFKSAGEQIKEDFGLNPYVCYGGAIAIVFLFRTWFQRIVA